MNDSVREYDVADRGSTVAAGTSRRAWLQRVFWLLLIGLNLIVLAMALPPLLRGDRDSYLNQHARLVAGAVTGLMLCGGFLVRRRWQAVLLMVGAFVSLGVSASLASGYAR